MKLSELIIQLQGVLVKSGDLNIFIGDMEAPLLELCETVDIDDVEKYGERYLFIDKGR